MRKPPPHESGDSEEASSVKPLTKPEAAEAMDRFKCLTRDLLNVPRAKIESELQRDKQRKARKRG